MKYDLDEVARVGRFIAVGVSNTLISFVTFTFMTATLPQMPARVGLSQTVAYLAGIIWSYYANGGWVFGQRGDETNRMSKFFFSQMTLLVLSVVFIDFLTRGPGFSPTVAWLVVMSVLTVVNFIVLRAWVFR